VPAPKGRRVRLLTSGPLRMFAFHSKRTLRKLSDTPEVGRRKFVPDGESAGESDPSTVAKASLGQRVQSAAR
jgi:hypothetical protein